LIVVFLLIDISKVQDDEVGDGTTSVVVLASELLRVDIPLKSFFDSLFFVGLFIGNRKFTRTKNSSSNSYCWLAKGNK